MTTPDTSASDTEDCIDAQLAKTRGDYRLDASAPGAESDGGPTRLSLGESGWYFSPTTEYGNRVLFSPAHEAIGLWGERDACAFAAALQPTPTPPAVDDVERVARAKRIVERLENARSDWFACEADTEEAVEIVEQELRTAIEVPSRPVVPASAAGGAKEDEALVEAFARATTERDCSIFPDRDSDEAVYRSRTALLASMSSQRARAEKAEAELAGARAEIERLRGALEPFARADRAIGDERGPFRFETGTGYRLIERDDLRCARAALRAAANGEPTR